MMVAQCIVDY
jgi:hypothetical protein